MAQVKFKSRNEWLEWRAHWRDEYQALASHIRLHKKTARAPTNDAATQQFAQSLLRRCQMSARSLMIAREEVKRDHQRRLKRRLAAAARKERQQTA